MCFWNRNPEEKMIRSVNRAIHAELPQLALGRPAVTKRTDGNYLLIYSVTCQTEDGATLKSILRVTADPNGKILKTCVSR